MAHALSTKPVSILSPIFLAYPTNNSGTCSRRCCKVSHAFWSFANPSHFTSNFFDFQLVLTLQKYFPNLYGRLIIFWFIKPHKIGMNDFFCLRSDSTRSTLLDNISITWNKPYHTGYILSRALFVLDLLSIRNRLFDIVGFSVFYLASDTISCPAESCRHAFAYHPSPC